MSILTLITICMCRGLVLSQVVSSISVSNDTVSIGDRIDVYYKLTVPKDVPVRTIDFNVLDSLDSLIPTSNLDTADVPHYADVEWDATFMNFDGKKVNYNLIRKKDLGNAYEYTDTFQAMFWDIGLFELQHPRLNPKPSPDTRVMNLEAPTVFIFSSTDLKNPDTTSVIMPIKDILTTQKTLWEKIRPWLYGLIPVVLGILLFLLLRKRKIEEEVIVVEKPKELAHVVAMRKLDLIAKQEDWKIGKVKAYQTDLTYTIREYLENRYEVPALESTTEEIATALNKEDLSIGQVNDIREILQIADLVKFAKAKPAEDINEQFLEKARQFVLDTKQKFVTTENQEADG